MKIAPRRLKTARRDCEKISPNLDFFRSILAKPFDEFADAVFDFRLRIII